MEKREIDFNKLSDSCVFRSATTFCNHGGNVSSPVLGYPDCKKEHCPIWKTLKKAGK